MSARQVDPRFETSYVADYQGVWSWRKDSMMIPSWLAEPNCCMQDGEPVSPGYRPKRQDKGYDLTVNDYPYHRVQLRGGMWSNVVYNTNSDLVGRKNDPIASRGYNYL